MKPPVHPQRRIHDVGRAWHAESAPTVAAVDAGTPAAALLLGGVFGVRRGPGPCGAYSAAEGRALPTAMYRRG
jgi:hypothetical protein